MARPREWLLESGDEIEVNGQVLVVVSVSDGADNLTIHLSDDYMLRIGKGKKELFKRSRLDPDREEITAVALSSLKIMKKE